MNCPTCKNPLMNSTFDCEWCGANLNNSINAGEEIYFFSAKWCGPCKTMLPLIDACKIKFPNLNFKLIDADVQKNDMTKFEIKNIPALLKVKNGIITNKIVGYCNQNQIEKFLLE